MVACTPHPGFGTVRIERPAIVRFVDLSSCRVTTAKPRKPTSAVTVVFVRSGKTGTESIEYRGRIVLTVHESFARAPAGMPGPIVPEGVSPDGKWILYAIDPQGSASLMADGLTLKAIRATGGRSFTVASGLAYTDYRAWCGGRLVITAGGDREATIHKQLVVTGPPDWKARPLTTLHGRAWGSIACTPDGRSVIVQSQPAEELKNFFATRWALWRVTLEGKATQLTRPPTHHADESPHFGPDGTLYFVRSIKGNGQLFALRSGVVTGPLLSLGHSLGYYGANAWPYTVTR
ncbi:MAG TPA: hypothetical protein VGG88_07975 [Gaiellaceae bacterium]